jgi:homoserine kinase
MSSAHKVVGGRSASVVVPASTANVGCAFDCAAIALGLHLRATATAQTSGFEVVYQGPDAECIPRDARNLIVKAMKHAAVQASADLPGARIEVENDVPLGVGLGSSAAAIVAGILLGAELCGQAVETQAVLRQALELEGHPDNIVAALIGGMVVSGVTDAPIEVLAAKAEVSQALDFIAVVPTVPLPTEKARAALPASYTRREVVANLQRTALLTAAFFSGKGITPELFRDRLHQPFRAPLIPGIAECLAYSHEGLAGVFLSGAGSAVMAIATRNALEIGKGLAAEFERHGIAARAMLLKADNHGAQLSTASGPRTFQAPSPALR